MSDPAVEIFSTDIQPIHNRISDKIRTEVLAGFASGESVKALAEAYNISTSGVRGIIKSSKSIEEVRNFTGDYGTEERKRLLNKAFFKVEQMVERCTDEFRMKSLVDTLNVLVHTKRIEEGLSGASATAAPFQMNVIVTGNQHDDDEMPELTAGDDIIDVNPIEIKPEAPPPEEPFD